VHALPELQHRADLAFRLGHADALANDVSAARLPADVQIAVYENNVRENYRKALLAAYPVVAALVGEACFAALAWEYQVHHPSASGNLDDFGASFALGLDARYLNSAHGYLGDVARLERACEVAMVAADDAPFDFAGLGFVPPERAGDVTFLPSASLQRLSSRYPVCAIWRAHREDSIAAVDLSRPERVLVWRRGDQLQVESVAASTWEFVDALAQGACLADAADCAFAVAPSFDAAAVLADAAARGLIVSADLPGVVMFNPKV
jgi:hypothetical protein